MGKKSYAREEDDSQDVDLSMVTRAVALFCASLTTYGSCGPYEDTIDRATLFEEYIHTGTISDKG